MNGAPPCPICRSTDATHGPGPKPWHCFTCNTLYSGSEDEQRASRQDRERYRQHRKTVQRLRDGETTATDGPELRVLKGGASE